MDICEFHWNDDTRYIKSEMDDICIWYMIKCCAHSLSYCLRYMIKWLTCLVYLLRLWPSCGWIMPCLTYLLRDKMVSWVLHYTNLLSIYVYSMLFSVFYIELEARSGWKLVGVISHYPSVLSVLRTFWFWL